MRLHRFLIGLLALAPLLFATSATAAERLPYEQQAFEIARQEGRPVLIDISASWCATCRIQSEIVSELVKRPQFSDLLILSVDYDTQKDVMRGLRAPFRSTLIVFRGGSEVGRVVGDTRWTSIEALLSSAL